MKRKSLVILTIFILTLSFLIPQTISGEEGTKLVGEPKLLLVDHSPIIITSDADFSLYPIILGSGIPGDPYVIDSLNITTTDPYGIKINYTTVPFIIRNCYIDADYPIHLDSVTATNFTISNNVLIPMSGAGDGLRIIDSHNFLIEENEFYDGGAGIFSTNSNGLDIIDNDFIDLEFSMYIDWSTGSWIHLNYIEECDQTQLYDFTFSHITNNTWLNSNMGFHLTDGFFTDIMHNVFRDNRGYAVSLVNTMDSDVENNFFVNNSWYRESQGYDNSGSNIWNNNFWSNLGDRSIYKIDGTDLRYDSYPFYDTDQDELDDYNELFVYGTDVNDEDSDDDLMKDGYEVTNSLNPLVNDAGNDPDSDSLTNLEEMTYGTDPQSWSSDVDLMPDGYEIENSLNPFLDDSSLDFDGDGLTNYYEYTIGTKANNFDSDEDGMSDSWEDENDLNPLINDAWDDPDNDTLNNFLEYIYDCNPHSNDTDGDSHIDSWEIINNTNPNDSSDYPDESMTTEKSCFALIGSIISILVVVGLITLRRRK
jgi:hypothetical protein